MHTYVCESHQPLSHLVHQFMQTQSAAVQRHTYAHMQAPPSILQHPTVSWKLHTCCNHGLEICVHDIRHKPGKRLAVHHNLCAAEDNVESVACVGVCSLTLQRLCIDSIEHGTTRQLALVNTK